MESSSLRQYEPKFGRVLIKREVKEKIGSIIIADAKRYASCEGVIAALGETAGWTSVPTDSGESTYQQTLKVGDRVLFGRHSGAWIDATYGTNGADNDDGSLFMCQDQDILAVIKE